MDRRNQPPAPFWGESLNFWCRLWQIQIEHSVRFWGALAAGMPRRSSAELAAEAEAAGRTAKRAAGRTSRAKSASPAPRRTSTTARQPARAKNHATPV